MELKNLDKLLAPKLGPNKKILNVEISKPPPSGVGSLMLKVKVTVQDQNNEKEQLHLVAKKIPPSEAARESFDIQNTFKKEVAFYEVIVPVLNEFRKEEGLKDVLDTFPEFYGARYSLKEKSEIVDEDAVLLLEDLSAKGFKNGDRRVGIDLNVSKKILQDLAKFNGTSIALKQKEPNIFAKKIRPHCTTFKFVHESGADKACQVLRQLIETFPGYEHFSEKATNFVDKQTSVNCREPFGAIIHLDLWVNNIMNKTEEDGSVKNVFVDFQLYGYRSPAADVFFFLWTSVDHKVLKQHLDHLLSHYHRSLLETLNEFNLDTSMFGYDKFEEEIRLDAEFEFGHALVFKFFLSLLDELNHNPDISNLEIDQISPDLREKVHYMVEQCAKRGWLY